MRGWSCSGASDGTRVWSVFRHLMYDNLLTCTRKKGRRAAYIIHVKMSAVDVHQLLKYYSLNFFESGFVCWHMLSNECTPSGVILEPSWTAKIWAPSSSQVALRVDGIRWGRHESLVRQSLAVLHLLRRGRIRGSTGCFFLHSQTQQYDNMEVSQVMGVPPNHPFIDGFSIIKHPCWGTPIYGKSHGMSMLGQYPLDPWFLSEPTMMVPDGCPIFGIIESTNQLISLRKCQCWAIPIGYMIIFQVAVN